MDDKKRLEEIEARAKESTPGPWERRIHLETEDGFTVEVDLLDGRKGNGYRCVGPLVSFVEAEDDAEFLAAAREDVPWLLSQLAQVQARIEAGQRILAEVEADRDYARKVADANLCCTVKVQEELDQAKAERDKAQADCAVFREALGHADRYLRYATCYCPDGDDGCSSCLVHREVVAALSTDAGLPLLRERDELRARLAKAPTLWECPECGFGFDSIHKMDTTDKYECPLCCELKVKAERDALKKRVADLEAAARLASERTDVA
jgi:hypothetical protein